jgi:hypothetical protein
MSDSLERRVIAALSSDAPSGDLQALILQTNTAISEAENAAAAARESAFDPARSADLQAAQREMENTALRLGRLQTLVPRLQAKYQHQLVAVAHARWLTDYESVKLRRDQLATRLAERYPRAVDELVSLFAEIADCDRACEMINGIASSLPTPERRRLAGCELTARGLDHFTTDAPPIINNVSLPDFDDSSRRLWPTPRPSLAAQYFGAPARRAGNEQRWAETEAEQQTESKRRYEVSLPR